MNMTHLEVNLVQHNGMWMDKDARDHMVALEDAAKEVKAAVDTIPQGCTTGMTFVERIKYIADCVAGGIEGQKRTQQQTYDMFRANLVRGIEYDKRIKVLEDQCMKYRAAIEQLTGIPESVELVPALREAVDKAGIKVDTNRAPGTIRPWTKPTVHRGNIEMDI